MCQQQHTNLPLAQPVVGSAPSSDDESGVIRVETAPSVCPNPQSPIPNT
jgi:hypothetical protein